MLSKEILTTAEEVVALFKAKGLKLTFAESCTGGMFGMAITSIVGSSDVLDRGFVTYSYESKSEVLGVDSELIRRHGAVSPLVASEMAKGALKNSKADVSVAITGIAGPGGATAFKPIGYVCIAVCYKENVLSEENNFSGNRQEVRIRSTERALNKVLEVINQ